MTFFLSIPLLQIDTTLADAALQYALLMFPGVLRPLLAELSVQTDSRANTHPYVGSAASAAQRQALQQLVALYTVRSKIVWQDAALLGWLERNVSVVLDRVEARDPIVADYAAKRATRYKTPPRAILRHIILSDFKEKVPLEPFINKDTEPILMYDPLPPLDSINIYQRPTNAARNARQLNDASPFSMFFQSLMPNFNVQEQVQQAGAAPPAAAPAQPAAQMAAADAAAAAVAAAGPQAAAAGAVTSAAAAAQAAAVAAAAAAVRHAVGADGEELEGAAAALETNMQSFVELRNSLNSIVDAMRDFLTNIRVPERPNDADVDENESSDDDEPNDSLT